MDRRILASVIEKYSGGPVGVDTLALSVGEEPETVEDVYEPFLVQMGFLQRTPNGWTESTHGPGLQAPFADPAP